MKQTGIVDRFEGNYIVVEINQEMVNISRDRAPTMLGEGMVVTVEDGAIIAVDEIETQRIEDDMRRRFERLLGAKDD